ncbi:hypothetical protein MK280_11930, partial [Myxococcota bacterium]|nr:hypothetical protein [Myxococcota bacterium]
RGDVVTVQDCLEVYEPEMLRWIFASQRPGSEFQISFDADVIKLYEDYDRARRLAHEAEDGSKADRKRRVARRTFELASLSPCRIEPGSPFPDIPAFRAISVVVQAYDGDLERTVSHFEALGEIQDEKQRKHCRERAACCWRWVKNFAPDEFRYRIRQQAVVRDVGGDDRIVLQRLVEVLRSLPDGSESDLVPHMKQLCQGTELTLKTFCPLAYDLLVGRDHGPKLTTLLTTMGSQRALPLLEPSLE